MSNADFAGEEGERWSKRETECWGWRMMVAELVERKVGHWHR